MYEDTNTQPVYVRCVCYHTALPTAVGDLRNIAQKNNKCKEHKETTTLE